MKQIKPIVNMIGSIVVTTKSFDVSVVVNVSRFNSISLSYNYVVAS